MHSSNHSEGFLQPGKAGVIPLPNAPLAVGDLAPDFELPSTAGPVIRLNEVLQRSTVVLFFYVKAFTPVCMAEVCSFRRAETQFQNLNAVVLGISSDNVDVAKRFAGYHRLPFPLLVDEENRVRALYRVPKLLGIFPGRSTFVIGQDRHILHITDLALQSGPHIEESLRSLQRQQQR